MTEKPETALAQPTSMEDVKERIALRIKASFVELMPEEAWAKMVKAELSRFAERPAPTRHETYPASPLQIIVRQILDERYRKMLKDELLKPEYQGSFDQYGQGEPGEFIKDFIRDNLPTIIPALLAGLGQEFLEHVKRSLRDNPTPMY